MRPKVAEFSARAEVCQSVAQLSRISFKSRHREGTGSYAFDYVRSLFPIRLNTMTTQDSKLLDTFNSTYEAEADAIFRFCLVRVSDREQALDLVQETFTRLWNTLSSGKEMSNSRAFLFTVAHRLIIDWYRKKKSLSLDAMANEESGEAYDQGDEATLGVNLEMGTEGRFLLEKINELNPSYRQAVFLRFAEGLSPPEIGDILGISANAASVRINRGIRELRKITGYDVSEV